MILLRISIIECVVTVLVMQTNGETFKRQEVNINVLFISLRLPQGVDLQHISSSLSGDGVLSVEAPAPRTSVSIPANEIVIPVQIRQTQDGEK